MVKRDPKLRDKFPPVAGNRIATDEERGRNHIPPTCRIVVPLGMPTDKFAYGFSDQLHGLATAIEHASKMDIPDVQRLKRIQMAVKAFNAKWRIEAQRAQSARAATNSAMTEADIAAEEWFQNGSKMMELYDETNESDDPQDQVRANIRRFLSKRRLAKGPQTVEEQREIRMAERNIKDEEWYKKGTLMMGLRDNDQS